MVHPIPRAMEITGRVAQVVKCLHTKCETLSLAPSIAKKKKKCFLTDNYKKHQVENGGSSTFGGHPAESVNYLDTDCRFTI
jgi:hypothetical protein